jgi:5-methylcytosine-specific restriction endonuclease McrA
VADEAAMARFVESGGEKPKREPRARSSLKRGKAPKQKTIKQKVLDARWEGIKDATMFWLRKLDPDGPHCFECGITKGPFDLDHIVPRGRGGKYWTFNAQLLCRSCHELKHGQPEWTAIRGAP